ncbi:hypothetical protein A6302_03230 [Methylobrevis pamukkalensis]|uniref:Uncharacterized protein n=1 Tax=Methylobrevis pamukkalensis TaxID=1439726 RepID=A0A1E3GZI6_9HYPH|nr:hypothetical protein A6302_03230 [Methylobrevis pamukkalensis]
MAAVEFRNVDIVFGDRQKAALAMIDEGKTRNEILEKTGSVLAPRACRSRSSAARSAC